MRTRRLLGEALLALLDEKRYEDITIQDLLDRADIGRTTFYAQYYDKDDLLSSQMEYVIAELCQIEEDVVNPQEMSILTLRFLHHVYEHRQSRWIHFSIHGKLGELLFQGLQTALGKRYESYLRARLSPSIDEVKMQVILHIIVGGFLAVVRWWVDADMQHSPEQIDAYFQQSIQFCFAPYPLSE